MDEADCVGLVGSWKMFDLYFELGRKPSEGFEQRSNRADPLG